MKIVLVTICCLLSVLSVSNAKACTAFAAQNGEDFYVGKNFDWYMGEGLVVVNPRGAVRVPVFSDATVPKIKWVSKFGSISFSTIGPGFPISGMNETGLVVEALHQLDFKSPLKKGQGLIALEWAQYVLDSFDTVADVARFAKQKGFGQFILPLQFFICDAGGNCIAVSGQGKSISVVSGKKLRVKVLANHKWQKDYRAYVNSQRKSFWSDMFGTSRSASASSSRFGRLAKRVKSKPPKTEDAVFKMLHKSRIPSLTKWQIIWQQTAGRVIWRQFANGQPQTKQRLSLGDIDYSCQPRPSVAAVKTAGVSGFHRLEQRDVSQINARLQKIEEALGAMIPIEIRSYFLKPIQCHSNLEP